MERVATGMIDLDVAGPAPDHLDPPSPVGRLHGTLDLAGVHALMQVRSLVRSWVLSAVNCRL